MVSKLQLSMGHVERMYLKCQGGVKVLSAESLTIACHISLSDVPWTVVRPSHPWGPCIKDIRKIFGIFDPNPLVRTLTTPIVLYSRNLPYYVCFWASPPLVRTSFMNAPLFPARDHRLPCHSSCHSSTSDRQSPPSPPSPRYSLKEGIHFARRRRWRRRKIGFRTQRQLSQTRVQRICTE